MLLYSIANRKKNSYAKKSGKRQPHETAKKRGIERKAEDSMAEQADIPGRICYIYQNMLWLANCIVYGFVPFNL